MIKTMTLSLLCLSVLSLSAVSKKANVKELNPELNNISLDFSSKNNDPKFIKKLKDKVMAMGTQSVPLLLKVMKDNQVSDQKRWMATFSLGRIMGKKATPLLAKYTRHPNWMLRLASLKTLMALDAKDRVNEYADALKDKSMIVRMQALENIRHFNLKTQGKNVWKMIFHKHNYAGEKGQRKRTRIISKAIRTLGDLKYTKLRETLAKLIQKDSYQDMARDLNYALEKMSGKKSPKSNLASIRNFWKTQKI